MIKHAFDDFNNFRNWNRNGHEIKCINWLINLSRYWNRALRVIFTDAEIVCYTHEQLFVQIHQVTVILMTILCC